MTKRCRRDKESFAKNHRNQIAGAETIGNQIIPAAEHCARMLPPAAVVVNLARLRPAKQNRMLSWIPGESEWLSGPVFADSYFEFA